jgi:twitching motility protein PilI
LNVADKKQTALEQTKRLLEAQRGGVKPDERLHRALCIGARGLSILVPIGDIVEIAVCENITPVPLTQPWIRGLTNVHGQLFTVVDLSVFLGGAETRLSREARIVILGQRAMGTCLLVNNVSGLKLYADENVVDRPSQLPAALEDFFSKGVRLDDVDWAVLDVDSLSRDEKYRNPSRVTRVAHAGLSV